MPDCAEVASTAICVTEAKVAWFNRKSPVPGSAIVVEESKFHFVAVPSPRLRSDNDTPSISPPAEFQRSRLSATGSSTVFPVIVELSLNLTVLSSSS